MLDVIVNSVFELGYIGFFLYMIVVGTFVPLPTQLILIPAGYLASQGRLDFMSIVLVTAMGTSTGALINYHLADYLSRRWIAPKKTMKLKKFFKKYGKISVFLAPLTFGLGQYISIPAGIAKMNLKWFVPIIFFSNSLWNIAMLMLGYMFGAEASREATYLVVGMVLFVVLVISILVYREFKSY